MRHIDWKAASVWAGAIVGSIGFWIGIYALMVAVVLR